MRGIEWIPGRAKKKRVAMVMWKKVVVKRKRVCVDEDDEGSQAEESGDEKEDGETEGSKDTDEEDEENAEGSRETEAENQEDKEVLEDEGESEVKENEPKVKGNERDILVLDEEAPVEKETPMNDRATRMNSRMARRLDEILAAKRARGEESEVSQSEEQAGDEIHEVQETTTEIEEVES